MHWIVIWADLSHGLCTFTVVHPVGRSLGCRFGASSALTRPLLNRLKASSTDLRFALPHTCNPSSSYAKYDVQVPFQWPSIMQASTDT